MRQFQNLPVITLLRRYTRIAKFELLYVWGFGATADRLINSEIIIRDRCRVLFPMD